MSQYNNLNGHWIEIEPRGSEMGNIPPQPSIIDISRFNVAASGGFWQLPSLPDRPIITDDLVERLWKRLYEKKPIVFCAHCNSTMLFDDPVCGQCGAPGGTAIR